MPAESLREIQQRFFAELLHPLWGDSRRKTPLPGPGAGPPAGFAETAERLLTPSSTLTPAERLELYHRQFWFRLIDSLDEDFPGLKWLLGDDAFFALLERYLVAHPPTAYSLRYLGAELPGYIAAHAPSIRYAVHAEELATLEYALCMAREAPEKQAIAPESLPTAHLKLQPHLRLFTFRTPADVLWSWAERRVPLRHLSQPKPRANRRVAVYRHLGRVHLRRLPLPEFSLLSAIADAHRLEDAIEAVFDLPAECRPKDQATIRDWFQRWCALGWITT